MIINFNDNVVRISLTVTRTAFIRDFTSFGVMVVKSINYILKRVVRGLYQRSWALRGPRRTNFNPNSKGTLMERSDIFTRPLLDVLREADHNDLEWATDP